MAKRRSHGLALPALGAFAWLAGGPTTARAEGAGRTAPVCDVGYLYPQAPSVPANMEAFLIGAPIPASPPSVRFVDTTEGEPADAPFHLTLRDNGYAFVPEALAAGRSYRIEIAKTCDGMAQTDTYAFAVTEAAAFPTSLGTIAATPLRASNFGSPGPRYRTYYVDVSFDAAPEMDPWRGIYGAALNVDGEGPRGGGLDVTSLEQNATRLFFDCGQDLRNGTLPEGHHTALLAAAIASFEAPIVVTNAVELDIDCANAEHDASTLAPPLASQTTPSNSNSGSSGGALRCTFAPVADDPSSRSLLAWFVALSLFAVLRFSCPLRPRSERPDPRDSRAPSWSRRTRRRGA